MKIIDFLRNTPKIYSAGKLYSLHVYMLLNLINADKKKKINQNRLEN
jgi:hypothetical protein